MYITIEHLARNRFLDPVEFELFALTNPKFLSGGLVGTYHVDALVNAYREHIGEERYLKERQTQICEARKNRLL